MGNDNRRPTKEDGLDALLFSTAALLVTSGAQALVSGDYYIAVFLFTTGFIAAVLYQALQRYHFGWEDDVNAVTPDAETIAATVENAAPPVAERIRDATTPQEEHTCEECGKTFETESELNGHYAYHQ